MAHNRPMAELLAPIPKDISPDHKAEFEGMAFENVSLERLQETLPRLVKKIHVALSDQDRRFLLSLKQGDHDWQAFSLPDVERLPAIQWKLLGCNTKKLYD